ncbi:hypothetical protein A3K34_01540 [candidate division WWE3 bacterium RIFOXYC1_FULL_40_10]|uniref:Thymidylate kinase-like domain-containing protein n=1 Tax=candidate division WWE3 bacterium RIFOXYA2_FULL_46_9 TaxID=1802636 RepID=A0A1F4W2L6_UNCKA|nr:MAG: hypothetical protein A3K58_01540 [candidate division WWE3 bacterium RIFOXYB1_FULL_40_22]OGC61548.1 MAG: hypothetical protein A3K37_01540 [candidate division WWE3 bacterium RIFOXYA1_FULL_40_11]OGC63595.1 MAG: hypothetical protein A2264_04480 [candidate division WWE3 bacterium RIFOXYA2_FULL_46_9]OGC64773.1 MAG: hypothetical protein A2326_01915 [candidate division WWE3 bacterium RIFOXYB2_FULL_41_6]OGC65931.1 MAG: hypothetical protein A3K34_01540 [candidate division WWE3 bacterium RIFOXYC1_
MKGKLITLYGSNNLGKSTQIRLLAQALYQNKKDVLLVKYPIYSLKPTGPLINSIIRTESQETLNTHKMTDELSLQKLYAQNRKDFQPTLVEVLKAGINVISEDYTGTGIAWGMTRGLQRKELEKINKGLINPDIAILLDGGRFSQSAEKFHRNEGKNSDKWEEIRQIHMFRSQEVWQRNREIHQELAHIYGWKIVNANGKIEEIHREILGLVLNSEAW